MKILAKYWGGSKMQGLFVQGVSDLDERYIFQNTDYREILGLGKCEQVVKINNEEDSVGFELKRYFSLLRKTNVNALETLFNIDFLELNLLFKSKVLDHPHKFIDSLFLYKSLRGYIQGEKRLVSGERSGNLGSKRKNTIEKYGYSYKNLVNLIRLAQCGACYFEKRYFPVNIREFDPDLADNLMEIKTNPASLNLETARALIEFHEAHLDICYHTRDISKDTVFQEKYANEVLLQFYAPCIQEDWLELKGIY